METEMAKAGITFQFFDAIDGTADWDDLKPTIDVPAFERNTGRHVMPGEIGCTHSHLSVWKALDRTEAPAGLILEDDVVLHPDFGKAVDTALGHIADWDLVKLNHIRAKWPYRKANLGTYTLNAYLGSFTGMGAYLLTRETANRLLPRMLPISRPIDHDLDRSAFHRIRHYALTPFPSHVDDHNQSTITGANFDGVQKFPRWQRAPAYWQRCRNIVSKTASALLGQ